VRKSIIALGTIALDTILLYIGSFFLYWGTWNYLYGHGTRPAGLEYLMMVFGGSMIIAGIIVVLKLIAFLSPPKKAPTKVASS